MSRITTSRRLAYENNSLRQQLASSDAEVAELRNRVTLLEQQLLVNNPLLDEAANEIDRLHELVKLLRGVFEGASQIITFEGVPYYLLDTYERDEALTISNPKEIPE